MNIDKIFDALSLMSAQLSEQQAAIVEIQRQLSPFVAVSTDTDARVLDMHERQLLSAINAEDDLFESDIMSADDMVTSLRRLFSEKQSHFYTARRVGRMMKTLARYTKVRAMHGNKQHRLWILRNFTDYNTLTANQIYHSYREQISSVGPPAESDKISFM